MAALDHKVHKVQSVVLDRKDHKVQSVTQSPDHKDHKDQAGRAAVVVSAAPIHKYNLTMLAVWPVQLHYYI